ncbi:amino acid adenylation domain-containing protein [Natronoglycomyces albus]|uniref:Amino acid adenylation domain-containing protein n=1 Tax=Natronoglycomyces albus TaxID=2811108 RepID=A0A895XM38_9ACTN|nr:amino acid adenylation domain-containing protein [Natronoglycomyces albus]QSB04842.1 amino acid adenylation domain-containing protein [Natronoglycomyces albus]
MRTAHPKENTPQIQLRSALPDLLRAQVQLRGESIVVSDDQKSLTYIELERACSQLSSHLKRLGVKPDDCVGIYADPSTDLMTGVWGILFSGAAYLPLSPDYPVMRLRYMIEDSKTRVILTQSHLREQLSNFIPNDTIVVDISTVEELDNADIPLKPGSVDSPVMRQLAAGSTHPKNRTPSTVARGSAGATRDGLSRSRLDTARARNLAYVIYTSGSTGKPKGVGIENRSIVSQMRWMESCGYVGSSTTVLQKTPMSFDAAQWEILSPAMGSQVVMGSPGMYRDPEAIISAIVKNEVTTVQCVPTLLQALIDTGQFHSCGSLSRVFSGGEALSKKLARTILTELPWVSLVNLYGPTECTINSTFHAIDSLDELDGPGSVPIGIPVDNTQCYILDHNMAPVDVGETGELYIGGAQLARGYLHRDQQTREKFVPSPFVPSERLYRTNDLAYWNPDGTIQFVGRSDNQIKLRGYRVELDEISLAIEEHTWVRRAAAIITDDPRTGHHNLTACIELNPAEAALMDQGNHGSHHQSKENKLQVKAQLSNPGLREASSLATKPVIALPGKEESPEQRSAAFGRKTYRFYEGGDVTRADIEALLQPPPVNPYSRDLADLSLAECGEIWRWFGQFHSEQRLLAKYSYASPGSLYATQMYVEVNGIAGLQAGIYYYHPADHTFVKIAPVDRCTGKGNDKRLSVHFIGKRSAIEPVYKNNILEVLEFETGHMVGVFEEILPPLGLTIRPGSFQPQVKDVLDVAAEDYYLGTFDIDSNDGAAHNDFTDVFVQSHPGRIADLPAGHYRYVAGQLQYLTEEIIQARHVIAINQQVWKRAAFGISAISRAPQPWLEYISLGTKLHHLQRRGLTRPGLSLGFMSSGYSSKTGNPLPASQRIDDILGRVDIDSGASYFFVGGKVSAMQIASEGMREDTVHMQGPAEVIREDLANALPDYMIPNRVMVLDALPQTDNGKVDAKALTQTVTKMQPKAAEHVEPSTPTEQWLARIWAEALKYDEVSIEDNFFTVGGNSLIAVSMVNRINRERNTTLPLQVLFDCPKLRQLAAHLDTEGPQTSSRLIRLNDLHEGNPVFCWPGLGGYPMNLRTLAQRWNGNGPFFGVAAHGINPNETPYATIGQMAAADIAELRGVQPEGPYKLWGYSFGARVAFEAAWQLEQAGEHVEEVLLLCPGNPRVGDGEPPTRRESSWDNRTYVTILLSVFTGAITGPQVERCISSVHDEESFAQFVHELLPELDLALIHRIRAIVAETFEFEYSFRELNERSLNAPVRIFKAQGDDYSFIEGATGYSATPPQVFELESDHYQVLKPAGVDQLIAAIGQSQSG